MFHLTNENLRARYLAEKVAAKKKGKRYSYMAMAREFGVTTQTAYTWVCCSKNSHLPANHSMKAALTSWINDGTLKQRWGGPDGDGGGNHADNQQS